MPVAPPGITFVGHATVLLELGGLRVLTDPVLGRWVGPLRRVSRPVDPRDVTGIDVVLLSHLHADHVDLPSLRRLRGARIVAPRGAAPWLRRRLHAPVLELGPGEHLDVEGVRITATTCVHAAERWPRGPQAEPVGYVVDDGSARVYFAGDTDLHDAMAVLGDEGLDAALLPVWGWGPNLGPGHLDPARAAEATTLLRPEVVVPIHWGTLAPPGMTRVMRGRLTLPPRELVAAAAGLPARVLVTEPGARVAW